MSALLLDGPAAEPVSLAEAKAWLRVQHDDDDDAIAALIAGSRIRVETLTRRALLAQTWRIVRDGWPADRRVPLLPVPLRDVIAVRVHRFDGGVHEIEAASFSVDKSAAPAVLATRNALPAPGRPVAGIEIDIESGYGDTADAVPAPLRQAVLMLTAHWYEYRGVVAPVEAASVLPHGVAALLSPYRVLLS